MYAEQDPKEGYERVAWYADEQFTQPVTGPVLAQGQTLYAQWLPNEYTIRFDPNGGSGSMEDQSFTYGAGKALSRCTFTPPADQKFAGWALSAGGPVLYRDEAQVRSLTAEDGAAVDLYAVWREDLTNQYLTALENAFTGYDAGDYTAQDWAALADIHNSAREGILADGGDGQQSICDQAVRDMAAVATARERTEEAVSAWESAHSAVIGQDALTEANAQTVLSAAQAALEGITPAFVAELDGFADAGEISAWAVESMAWACGAGLVTGVTGETLEPAGGATRAQTAVLLMRFCESVASGEETR